MFPSTYIPFNLCFLQLMFPSTYVFSTYVPFNLCSLQLIIYVLFNLCSIQHYVQFNFHKLCCTQGGTGIGKKDLGSIFFLGLLHIGLTNYVIRHTSQYSNLTSFSSPPSFASSARCLTRPVPWFMLKFYTLEVVLFTYCESNMNHSHKCLLTHCVSQPGCLHLRTPLDELLRTNPHRHPFSASVSHRGTLFRFDSPASSGT